MPTTSAIAEIRDVGAGVAVAGGVSTSDDSPSPSSELTVSRRLAPRAIIATGNVDKAAGCSNHVTAMTATNAASAPVARRPGVPREHGGEHETDDPQRHGELDDDVVGVEDDRRPVVRSVLANEVSGQVLLDRGTEATEPPSEHGTLEERRPAVAPDVEPSARRRGRDAAGRARAVTNRGDEASRDERAHDIDHRQLPSEPPPCPHGNVGKYDHGRAERDTRSRQIDRESEQADEPQHECRTPPLPPTCCGERGRASHERSEVDRVRGESARPIRRPREHPTVDAQQDLEEADERAETRARSARQVPEVVVRVPTPHARAPRVRAHRSRSVRSIRDRTHQRVPAVVLR